MFKWLLLICLGIGIFSLGFTYLQRVLQLQKYYQRVQQYQAKYYIAEMRCPRCFQVFPKCLDPKVFQRGIFKCQNCHTILKKPWLGTTEVDT